MPLCIFPFQSVSHFIPPPSQVYPLLLYPSWTEPPLSKYIQVILSFWILTFNIYVALWPVLDPYCTGSLYIPFSRIIWLRFLVVVRKTGVKHICAVIGAIQIPKQKIIINNLFIVIHIDYSFNPQKTVSSKKKAQGCWLIL